MVMSAFRRLGVAAIVVFLCAGGLSTVVDTRGASARAEDWAVENVDSLPSTVDELTKLPMEFRRAALKKSSPEVLSKLWQEHLARLVGGDSLSQQAVAFVNRAQGLLTPQLYADKADLAPAIALCQDMKTSLDPREIEIINGLGGPSAPTADGWLVKFTRRVETLGALFAADQCNCSMGSMCNFSCDAPYYCVQFQVSGCAGYNPGGGNGCGCFGMFPCDGQCGMVIYD